MRMAASRRIFALNLLHLEPAAATFRMLRDGSDLIVAQGEMENGRVIRYVAGVSNRRTPFSARPGASAGPDLLGGKQWRASRLVRYPGGGSSPLGHGVHTLVPYRRGALAIGADAVTYLRK